MDNNSIDPERIVRLDADILETTSHYLRLAPFLVIVNAENSAIIKPVNRHNVMDIMDWSPPSNSRVCGVFGTCPTTQEYHHTIGIFAINPYFLSNVKETIIYIIDGKDNENDENYLQCRNTAVNMFKTQVMKLSSLRPHSSQIVGFSSMRDKDRINSSLHVRQCFRELAGFFSVSSLITSAKVLTTLVNDGFSLTSSAHAFHSNAMFDGVRLQIAKRCWTKDLEDALCFYMDENVQYEGSYGSEITEPLDDDAEGLEARNARQLVATLCANALCDKPAKKKCPKCAELGLPRTRYCGYDCYKICWSDHDLLHKQAEAYQRQQQTELENNDGCYTCDDGAVVSIDGDDNVVEVKLDDPVTQTLVDGDDSGDIEEKAPDAIPKVDQSLVATASANNSEGSDNVEGHALKNNDNSDVKLAAPLKKTDPSPVAEAAEVVSKPASTAAAKPAGVRITGATGPAAKTINGVYEPMKAGVFRKAGSVRLEYRAPCKQWQVKTTSGVKTTVLAVCDVPVKCSIHECLKRRWQVAAANGKLELQPAVTISVASEEEVAACRAEMQEEAACVAKGIYNVRIAGASGQYGYSVNGVYYPKSDDQMVYDKVGGIFILEYYAPNNQWQVKLSEYAGKDESCNAYLAVPSQCHPHQCPPRQWKVWDGSKHVSQPSVSISMASEEEVEAYSAEVEDEAARVVKGICSVRVEGAKDSNAAHVNGIHEPTNEMWNNVTVFRRVGDDTILMEYNASGMSWQVKLTANKGTNVCYALCAVPAKCLPHQCPARLWKVWDGSKHVQQPSVRISMAGDNAAH